MEDIFKKEITRLSNDIKPFTDTLEENLRLLQQDPLRTIVTFFQNNVLVLPTISLLFIISGCFKVYNMRKQKREESDIKNMFNSDGTKNQHLRHKDYNPLPSFVFALLAILAQLLISTTTI